MAVIPPIGFVGGVSPIASTGAADALGATGGPSAIGASGGLKLDGAGAAQGAQGQGSFVDLIADAFGQLNTQLTSADTAMADFAAGGSADLHTVMLQMQEASLGLKVGLQVRDKLLDAYQEIMRLQI